MRGLLALIRALVKNFDGLNHHTHNSKNMIWILNCLNEVKALKARFLRSLVSNTDSLTKNKEYVVMSVEIYSSDSYLAINEGDNIFSE